MIVTTRQEYYQQPYVLFNMIPRLKYRYLSARKLDKNGKGIMVRYYLGYNIDLLKQSLQKLGVLNDSSIKLYFDISKWEKDGNMPMFSFNKEKREDDKERFNNIFEEYFKDYHFAIDLDSDDDIMNSWRDAKKIKNEFDKYKLPYQLKFSGGRGFHFLIEDKWFSTKMKAKNKVRLFGRIATVIMDICKLKSHNDGGTFDDSIYDDRRIFKLDYSLNYKDGKEYVCLPLSNKQFENFKLSGMELMNVMKNVKFIHRGFLERDHGLTEKELKNNVNNFLKEMK